MRRRPPPDDAEARPLLPARVDTPRLVLRQWTAADVPDMSAALARNDAHLRPWMPWMADEPRPDADRCALVASWERTWRAGGDTVLGVFLRGEVVGGCGLHRRRGPHGLEIGYWVDAAHTRRGYATELAGALTDAAFDVPGVTFVEIHHDRANEASAGVPRRLGFTFAGERPDAVDAPGEVGADCTWRMEIVSWPASRARLPHEPGPA